MIHSFIPSFISSSIIHVICNKSNATAERKEKPREKKSIKQAQRANSQAFETKGHASKQAKVKEEPTPAGG
jgi:hypothetical protein